MTLLWTMNQKTTKFNYHFKLVTMERVYIFISPDNELSVAELNLILEFFPDDDGQVEETVEDRGSYWRYWFIADFYEEEGEESTEFDPEHDNYEAALERSEKLCGRLNFVFPYTFKVNNGSQYGKFVNPN